MSSVQITPMTEKAFGATVTGVDLKNLSETEFGLLVEAFLEKGFLLFPDQHLTEAESTAFGERFGELEFCPLSTTDAAEHP